MHCFDISKISHLRMTDFRLALVLLIGSLASSAWSQETDFSPYARYGFGTWQEVMTPGLAAMGGVSTVTGSASMVNPNQPASAAGMANPTFQSSFFSQQVLLREGDSQAQITTGGIGNLGLVVKKPQSVSGFTLGLTPLTSKSFSIRRSTTDPLLGNISEIYDGQGGMARAYSGYAKGWRAKKWVQAGSQDSVLMTKHGVSLGGQLDYWFGDAIQTSYLDIEDLNYRDVRAQISNRHRSAGWTLGVESFHTIWSKFSDNKQFLGSLTWQLGGTWSPAKNLSTDYSQVVQSTVIVSGVIVPVDTSFYDMAEKTGVIPSKWTAGTGLVWNGKTGHRLELYVDHHRQSWGASADTLAFLMDSRSTWSDATRTAVGMAWTPGRKSGKINRLTWRTGFNWSTLPVNIQVAEDQWIPLEEWRASLGLSAPLKGSRSASKFHVGMDFGRRGTTNETLHEEFNTRLHIGWSMTPFVKNLWLTPRLYD